MVLLFFGLFVVLIFLWFLLLLFWGEAFVLCWCCCFECVMFVLIIKNKNTQTKLIKQFLSIEENRTHVEIYCFTQSCLDV